METNKLKDTQCMIIYQFLKDNCVSKANAKGGQEICDKILSNPKTTKYFPNGLNKVMLQNRVNRIRKNLVDGKTITRRIGSSPKGYWLDTKRDDDGIEFLKKLAVSHLQTAIKSGVKCEYFYQILNRLENENVVDGQTRIPVSPYQKNIVRVYSDDILLNE